VLRRKRAQNIPFFMEMLVEASEQALNKTAWFIRDLVLD